MSEYIAERWLTSELAEGLSWPGFDLAECELIKTGTVIGFDRDYQTIEFERRETVEGEPYFAIGILEWAGVEVHPPMTGAHPLDTGQTFWHVRDPETGQTAILRNPDSM